jgi:uncharacterized protein YbcC (UPF0753/DUF2309 family)
MNLPFNLSPLVNGRSGADMHLRHSPSLGQRLKVRSMVVLAGEVLPYFWPMRSFIHHNPLHGLEDLPFDQAVARATGLFHARGYLRRTEYQDLLRRGSISEEVLGELVDAFMADWRRDHGRPAETQGGDTLDFGHILLALLTRMDQPTAGDGHASTNDILDALIRPEHPAPPRLERPIEANAKPLAESLGREQTVYDMADQLFGTRIGVTLNELLIKGCMDFFDEGQSVWRMPGRRQGLYRAWSDIARRNRRLRMRGLDVGAILECADGPEAMIDLVMTRLEIPEALWMDAFAVELSRLHGWAGFVRWRAQARHYYWQQRNPADLVDYLAIRLVLALALIEDTARRLRRDLRYPALHRFIEHQPYECLLRRELHAGTILPDYAHRVEMTLDGADPTRIETLCREYALEKTAREASVRAERIRETCERAGVPTKRLLAQDPDTLRALIESVHAFKADEGILWTRALEQTYIRRLLSQISGRLAIAPGDLPAAAAGDAANGPDSASAADPNSIQALFCIDVRSERLRRRLEGLGPYQTFGIAGFFGVPVSFIELGKGHETALCPAIVTPKNVALELPQKHEPHRPTLFHLAHEVVRDLKSTVLAPYVTVEAVGLLYGFDMVGKTMAPRRYNRWRRRLEGRKPRARLLIDKITEQDARELVAHLQEAMIVKAVEQHFGTRREALTTAMIEELRATALGERRGRTEFARRFAVEREAETVFISALQVQWRVNPDEVQLQLENLARIGFRIKRQALLVRNALRGIGLTAGFGRAVLVVGHGSTSENNPYESALDCGACGGDRGLTNARIFAAMANRREVRALLAEQGIQIPEETWFIPAMHDTTTDRVELHDLDQLPPGPLTRLERIQEDLAAAGRLCAQERCVALGEHGVDSPRAAARRVSRNALDWTQVRPEWGLSRNACFIIGRRALTAGVDLEGRAFLHSYDHRIDTDGHLLEGIMAGPLVVGQWINMEHYFSTVDNEAFGSGSKVYHNIIGRFGIITGNVSDLRTGLPAQTMLAGDRPYHEPMRLITVIEAPLAKVQGALNKVYKARELVHNGWIRMLVLDPESGDARLYRRGEWGKMSSE